MVYEQMNVTNTTTFLDMVTYANSITGNMLGVMFLIGLWAIFYIVSSPYDKAYRITAASWITALIAFFFIRIDILPTTYFIYPVLLILVSLFLLLGAEKPRY